MTQELKAYNVVATADVNPEVVDRLGCTEFEAYNADDVDAVLDEKDAEIRRLKRALWLTRAERADDRARIFYFNDLETMLDIDGFSYDRKKKKGCKKLTALHWRIIWLKVERKCRAKEAKFK